MEITTPVGGAPGLAIMVKTTTIRSTVLVIALYIYILYYIINNQGSPSNKNLGQNYP